MTISDVLTVLGAGAGILLLALMATVPLLLDLPLRRRASTRPTVVPAPRVAHRVHAA